MRTLILLVPAVCSLVLSAQSIPSQTGPTDPKAQKTFADAQVELRKHDYSFAIKYFRKADEQDGGRCLTCERQAIKAAVDSGDNKAAAECARTLLSESTAPADKADAHYEYGMVLYRQGMHDQKDKYYSDADQEFKAALEITPQAANLYYADGLALAHLKHDEAATSQFELYIKLAPINSVDRQRAQRYVDRPELARAHMAPTFSVTTLDGKHLTLDDLAGKVVLIDFWATWCGPCKEALPHIKEIAHKFQGQPLVVLSVSLDKDANAWREFVEKHEMTWMQYRDEGFEGKLATLFAVHSIPHTFSIDSDGVLQDEHVGDGSIEGKLKKLVAQAQVRQSAQQKAQAQ